MCNCGTIAGQLDILKNAIEQAEDSHMYPPVETSGCQEWYYRRSTWHTEECNSASSGKSYVLPLVETSGGQEWYYSKSTWHSDHIQLSRQWTVRQYPLVEASGGQEWYYSRSTSHSKECNWAGSGQSDIPPPSRGIWQPRAVLHQISFTFIWLFHI